ncbi:MAG: tripartite tricarboxylate transporter family receptor [Hyphomicrobiales bacterium]|nr:tripartite tricarboxylate transporter family receptor [Hyphomicrobiales bacterium]
MTLGINRLRRLAALSLIVIGTFAVSTAAPAGEIDDFYRGKTLTMVVGYPPGGSYDLYARMIARYLGNHIPGQPKLIVQNMPGAGSLLAANHIANVAPQDGTFIGAVSATTPFTPLLEPNAARFDAAKINWMPSPASFIVVTLVWHSSPAKTFADLKSNEVLMATLNPSSTPSFLATILNEVLKTKIKLVYGYTSMAQSLLAMERGEAEGYPSVPIDSLRRSYPQLLAEKKVRLLLQLGGAPSPDFPDVPFVLDQAESQEDRQLLDMSLASLKIGYPYLIGPNVPKARVAALRKAMMDTFADPEFKADAAKQTLDVAPVTGDEVQRIIEDVYNSPPALRDRLRAIYLKQAQ